MLFVCVHRGLGRSVFGQRTVVAGRPSCRVGLSWESPLGSSRSISPALNSREEGTPGPGEKSEQLAGDGKETVGMGPWRQCLQRSRVFRNLKLYKATKPQFQRMPKIGNRQKQRRSPRGNLILHCVVENASLFVACQPSSRVEGPRLHFLFQ